MTIKKIPFPLGRSSIKIVQYLELWIIFSVSLLTIGSVFINLGEIGSIFSFIGVFIIPGWLLTRILFYDVDETDRVIRFILTIVLGAVLVFLETFVLSILRIEISREIVILIGTLVTWLLLGALIYQRRIITNNSFREYKSEIKNLLGLIIFIPILIFFILLHKPVTNETYTEFYISPQMFMPTNEDQSALFVTIVNHENKTLIYKITCEDNVEHEELLTATSLISESSQTLVLPIDPSGVSSAIRKIRVNLYRDIDTLPYRWVEIGGISCIQELEN